MDALCFDREVGKTGGKREHFAHRTMFSKQNTKRCEAEPPTPPAPPLLAQDSVTKTNNYNVLQF